LKPGMIQVPEEDIETRYARQKLVAVAQVVFSELSGAVSLCFKNSRRGRVLVG
jgi:hypothetical protein